MAVNPLAQGVTHTHNHNHTTAAHDQTTTVEPQTHNQNTQPRTQRGRTATTHNHSTQPQHRATNTQPQQCVAGGHRVVLLDANWRPWRHPDANPGGSRAPGQRKRTGPAANLELNIVWAELWQGDGETVSATAHRSPSQQHAGPTHAHVHRPRPGPADSKRASNIVYSGLSSTP